MPCQSQGLSLQRLDYHNTNCLSPCRTANLIIHQPCTSLSSHFLPAGDGDCAFRAILWSLVEQASYRPASRAYLTQQLTTHMKSLPGWAINATHHDNRGSSAREGYAVLLVGILDLKMPGLKYLCFVSRQHHKDISWLYAAGIL